MKKLVTTLGEFETEATAFVAALTPSEQGATLVTLSGELGAGKTAFTKTVAWALGIEEVVTSPTFVLEKIYRLPQGKPFTYFIHIDAYRLESGEDLVALGFDELIKDTEALIMLEWPEKVADALPTPSLQISLTAHPDGSRTISYG